jgi:hypothetical protein
VREGPPSRGLFLYGENNARHPEPCRESLAGVAVIGGIGVSKEGVRLGSWGFIRIEPVGLGESCSAAVGIPWAGLRGD